jgi:hypothetical protein
MLAVALHASASLFATEFEATLASSQVEWAENPPEDLEDISRTLVRRVKLPKVLPMD